MKEHLDNKMLENCKHKNVIVHCDLGQGSVEVTKGH